MRILVQKNHAARSAWFIGFMALFALILAGCANSATVHGEDGPTDPQKLFIPRWFLFSLELEGQTFAIGEDQQSMTLQFKEDGSANGGGGCNNLFTTFEVTQDGLMQFGPVGATKMMCEQTTQLENAYFEALAQVEQFYFDAYRLVLSSADGKTKLIFRMPPK